jgi:hypothetical protein
MIRLLLIVFFTMILASACIKKSKVSDIPQISYIKTINDTISLISGDSVNELSIVTIGYTIKNGEVSSSDSVAPNLIFTETTSGNSDFSYLVPKFIGLNTKYDAESGIMEILVGKDVIKPNSINPIVETYWDVQLTNRLGKKSNIIKVGPIFVKQ